MGANVSAHELSAVPESGNLGPEEGDDEDEFPNAACLKAALKAACCNKGMLSCSHKLGNNASKASREEAQLAHVVSVHPSVNSVFDMEVFTPH